MRADEKKALIFELADVVLKSWWTLVAGVCFGLTGALVALGMVTEWYESRALIYVTPELTRELARSTVSDDMTRRISALQEAVLGPEYLRRMVDETFGPSESEEQLQARIRYVRRQVMIEPAAVGGTRGAESLFAFNVTYVARSAEEAAAGANMLAELYIEQNQEFRTGQAREALRAAEDQASRAKGDYDEIDRRLIEFRTRHRFETEDHQSANLSLFERRQHDLDANLTEQRESEIRIQDLKRSLAEAEAGAATTAEEVATLRAELDGLLSQYSEAHPSVIRVRRKLQDAMAELGISEDKVEAVELTEAAFPPDPRVTALKSELEGALRHLTQLAGRESKIRTDIVEYERRIDAVPTVQPQLSRLLTEHQMLRERYELAQNQADKTRESLFLEETLSGERFELVERAEVPSGPFFPRPERFYALGVVVGLMLFVGPLLGRGFLSPVVSSESGLIAMSEVPVLVTIPRVITAATRGRALRTALKNLALSTLCLALAATAIIFLGG